MSKPFPAPPKSPCGSCPYRRDVAPGIWESVEYDKLPEYDGPTWGQSPALFMCHQQDGKLCGGWLACHDTDHLLALRMHRVDQSAFEYESPVPVFGSGAEARTHGMRDVSRPSRRAQRMIDGILRKCGKANRPLPPALATDDGGQE